MITEKLAQLLILIKRFIRRRFNTENKDLPYYITIAISATLFTVALGGFIELTDDLAANELQHFDHVVTEYVISFRTEALTDFFTFATNLGDITAYVVCTLVLAAGYHIRHKGWKLILQTVLVLMLATASNVMLKKVINRSRPVLEHLVSVNTSSYPSGHSMSAMAFYGFLIFLCIRYDLPAWVRYPVIVMLVLVIASVGISRIYLGVHFPSDVAAGFIGGLIWVTFCAVVFSLFDLRKSADNAGD